MIGSRMLLLLFLQCQSSLHEWVVFPTHTKQFKNWATVRLCFIEPVWKSHLSGNSVLTILYDFDSLKTKGKGKKLKFLNLDTVLKKWIKVTNHTTCSPSIFLVYPDSCFFLNLKNPQILEAIFQQCNVVKTEYLPSLLGCNAYIYQTQESTFTAPDKVSF